MENASLAVAICSLGYVSQPQKIEHELTVLAFWVSSGVMMQGFDIVAGGQLAALPAFQKQFGILEPSGNYLIPAHYLSAWSSIAPACEVVATFIVAPSLEKFGRKPGILVAMMISVAGILLQQLATDWRTHLAGRGVNGE
jgi:MFS family permease